MTGFKNCPACNRTDCFANNEERCMILSKNDFNKPCPFFKTRGQVEKEKVEREIALLDELANTRKGE